MCATAEGWGQHPVLAGLEGGGESRRDAGFPGCVLVVDTEPSSCFPAPPHLPLALPWTPPYPLSVFMGFIPWVHMPMLAFLPTFEMPV